MPVPKRIETLRQIYSNYLDVNPLPPKSNKLEPWEINQIFNRMMRTTAAAANSGKPDVHIVFAQAIAPSFDQRTPDYNWLLMAEEPSNVANIESRLVFEGVDYTIQPNAFAGPIFVLSGWAK